MTDAVSDLHDHAGYWLRLVSNHVSGAFARKIAAHDLSVAEWVILRLLYRADRIPSHVARETGLTRGAITKITDRLIARALVARLASPDDGRSQRLRLTAKGRKLVPVLAAAADRNDAEFFDPLSAAERQALDRVLRKLAAHHAMTGIASE